jgi:hypothetical protein
METDGTENYVHFKCSIFEGATMTPEDNRAKRARLLAEALIIDETGEKSNENMLSFEISPGTNLTESLVSAEVESADSLEAGSDKTDK